MKFEAFNKSNKIDFESYSSIKPIIQDKPIISAGFTEEDMAHIVENPLRLKEAVPALIALANEQRNCSHLLPLFFRLAQNQSFSLVDFFPFIPMYDTELSVSRLWITGRQASKSTNLCVDSLSRAMIVPNFRQLYVTPLYEQARRFSSNYVQRFIANSYLNSLFVDSSCEQNVLQKTFTNGSMLMFTYCYRDVERARGISCDSLVIDEVQDINFDFIPILAESMSASRKWRITTYAGTPKTTDNTISRLHKSSSRGEWAIRCSGCRKENISAISEDLLNMLGDDGLICAKCHSPINTEEGMWLHGDPDKINKFVSWHVPQAILPMHCRDERAWDGLMDKSRTYKRSTFYNEVLGEDCDAGIKLISKEALMAASTLPHHNTLPEASALNANSNFVVRSLGVDWGGRGENCDSLTALTVVGLRTDGKIDVVYGELCPPSMDDMGEMALIDEIVRAFRINIIGHDFNGMGMSKDTMIIQRGHRRVVPWINEGNANYLTNTRRTPANRHYVRVNRAAGATLLAHEINHGRIAFPKWEPEDKNNAFLGLTSWFEDYISRPNGNDLYQVLRSASLPDDIAMSLMYACFSAWRITRKWPQFSTTLGSHITSTKSEEDVVF